MRAELISSSRAKVARADEHLELLKSEMNRWGELDPMRLSRTSEGDGRQHFFHLHIDPVPDLWRWGMLLADGVHNLRCALDHMVYSLGIVATGQDPPEGENQLAFPICDTEPGFRDQSRRRLMRLTSEMQATIERFQPYNRRNPRNNFAALAYLRDLDDINKHRMIHLTPLYPSFQEGSITLEPGTFKLEMRSGAIVNDAPFAVLTLVEPDPDVYVDLRFTTTVVVETETHPLGVEPLIGHMRSEVIEICKGLSQLIPA